MVAKKAKRGPKPKPKSERQTERVEVKFTPLEKPRVDRCAGDGWVATWIHDLVMAEVERIENRR